MDHQTADIIAARHAERRRKQQKVPGIPPDLGLRQSSGAFAAHAERTTGEAFGWALEPPCEKRQGLPQSKTLRERPKCARSSPDNSVVRLLLSKKEPDLGRPFRTLAFLGF
jgi:hypothetical protein